MAIAAVAARQDAAARASWKKLFSGETPPFRETPYLLLYGTIPGKSLKDIGERLNRQIDLARTALEMDQVPWPGKLTVFMVPERARLTALVRHLEQRNPEPEETGSVDLRADPPHVIAGPPRTSTDPSIENEAGQLIAGALLTKKAGAALPEWVTDGFGRATVLLTGPKAELLAEHRKASQALVYKKRTAADVWDSRLPVEDAGPLRETLIEYLAYSKRFSRFDQFLAGFRVDEKRPNPTTLDALKAANVNPQRLNTVWQAWVRMFR
jgi:hypothetical protein